MPEIEYATLANHAEAINNLLYLQGAGWNQTVQPTTPTGPGHLHFGIGLSILVGWNETNQPFTVLVKILDEDGSEVLRGDIGGQIGRPPGAKPGSDLRLPLALNTEIQFPHPGGYVLHAEIGNLVKNVSFHVAFASPSGAPTNPAIPGS